MQNGFKRKIGSDGQIDKKKARLVARGFTQVYGVDYNETFAPVTKLKSVRSILAMAVEHDLKIIQLDVKTAFLNGELKEDIQMEIPKIWRNICMISWLKKASTKIKPYILRLELCYKT